MRAMERIVSLLPSATEIVCALGFGDQLVGRSHECDYPAAVASLPVLTQAKLDDSRPSAEIDDAVKQLVAEGSSVYRVDAELLRELAPSVIVTQDQCAVCAVTPDDLRAALASLTGSTPKLVSLSPNTLGDVWVSFSEVAAALGVPQRGAELAGELANRITEVTERTQARGSRPRVACIEWLDPLMLAGNWVPELVTLAGGESLLAAPGAHSPWLDADDLLKADPDAIVLMPCGFDLARTRAEFARVAGAAPWGALRAVQHGRVAAVDGNRFFNRPGPRLVESLEILAEFLHPDSGARQHDESAWQLI